MLFINNKKYMLVNFFYIFICISIYIFGRTLPLNSMVYFHSSVTLEVIKQLIVTCFFAFEFEQNVSERHYQTKRFFSILKNKQIPENTF